MADALTCRPYLALLMALLAGSCGPTLPHTPTTGPDLTAEVITVSPDKPADLAPGECWDTDVIPAVIETTTEQSLVSAEVRDDQGQVVSPASYKSVSRLRMVQDRAQVWFRVPCPDLETADFWATAQRALKARGYYLLPLTGAPDAATAEALRRFQAERGLDSKVLSLAAARELGLVVTPVDQLD